MRKVITLLLALAVALAAAGCGAKKENSVKLTPEEAKVKAQEGLDLVQAGKYAEANQVLEQVAKSDQGDAKTYILLGATRYQKQDYKGALEAYDKAIALDPKRAEAYQGKGNVYRNQKNLKEAEVWYRKAWQVNPKFQDPYTELAIQFSLANRLSDAIAVLQEGIKNNPESVEMHMLIGGYYRDSGDKDKAKGSFEAVLKIDANNKAAKDALAALK